MYQTAIPMISPLDVSCMPGLLPDVIQYDPAIHLIRYIYNSIHAYMQCIHQYHAMKTKPINSDQRFKISCGLNIIFLYMY